MTLKEAKKLLKKEMVIVFHSTEPFEFDESGWIEHEKPSVLEAFRVLAKEGYYISISGHDYNMRKERLKKEYEENTKAPGTDENSIKGDLSGNESIEHCGEPIPGSPLSAVEGIKLKQKDNQNTTENPALAESATQFNDALLHEQAKKIEELTEENERLKDQVAVIYACKENNEKYNLKQIKRLGKEIARLNKIIHKKNLKIEELGKESSRHLRGKIKMFCENVDLEQMLKDKDAVLSDVAEELRLSKIREKNLTEVSQKYMKENEELKKKVADLGKELKATKKELKEKTKLVEIVRKHSKEFSDYGIAAEKMIQKMAKEFVNDKPVSSKDYEQYRLWAKGYRVNPQLPDFSEEEEKSAESTLAYKDEVIETLDKELAEAKHELSSLKRPFRPDSTEAVVLFANAYAKAEKKHLRCAEWRNDGKEVSITYILKNGKKSKITLDFTGDEIIFSRTDPDKKPHIPTPEEPKHDNSREDFIKKTIDGFNIKAVNLGSVGSNDGNGIIDQMIGVDIAEKGADLSGVFVL